MALKKGDFIEIEFTGRMKEDGTVFDTNIAKDAKDSGLEVKDPKPFIMSIGNQMLPKGFDADLEGKETEKSYTVEVKPEDAFGKREKAMIKMIPTKLFHEQQINPERGMQLALDGRLVKVLSNSGGRTLVDFNHPLAGKEVVYDYKILRAVDKIDEKINALQDFLFRRQFKFKVEGKKITFEVAQGEKQYIEMFAPKFEEILGDGMKIEAKEVKEKGDKAKDSKEMNKADESA